MKLSLAFALLLLVVPGSPDQATSRHGVLCKPSYRIVAQLPRRDSQQEVIAIDGDRRVLLLAKEEGRLRRLRTLGFEATVPSDFPFSGSISKSQAITGLYRLSCTDSEPWRLWIVTTIGINELQEQGPLAPGTFLYVFRESQSTKALVLRRGFVDITQLILDDINGDGSTELAVQYTDGSLISPSTLLALWQISRSGQVTPVALDNVVSDLDNLARKMVLSVGDYKYGDLGLYSEAWSSTPKGLLRTQRHYRWDRQNNRYVVVSKVVTEERKIS